MHVQQRADRFDRRLRRRDLRESLAGVFVVGACVYTAYHAPGYWPWIGAAALIVGVLFVLWLMRRSHRTPEGAAEQSDATVVEHLRREIEKVRRQEALLLDVGRWYVMPIAIGAILWTLSLVLAAGMPPRATVIAALVVAAVTGLLFALIGYGVVRLNRHAVERDLRPYREELEASLAEVD